MYVCIRLYSLVRLYALFILLLFTVGEFEVNYTTAQCSMPYTLELHNVQQGKMNARKKTSSCYQLTKKDICLYIKGIFFSSFSFSFSFFYCMFQFPSFSSTISSRLLIIYFSILNAIDKNVARFLIEIGILQKTKKQRNEGKGNENNRKSCARTIIVNSMIFTHTPTGG